MSLFNNVEKPIGLASDHAGFEAKQYILGVLKEQGIPYKDFGTYSGEAVDYADSRTRWPWPWKRASATPVSLFAVVVMVST